MKEATIDIRETLSRGLAMKNNPRNRPMLTDSTGMFVYEGALASAEQFTAMTLPTPVTPFAFPFPELIPMSDYLILCNVDQIWEWSGAAWVSVLQGIPAGQRWSWVDRKGFLLLSNMTATVTRDPNSGVYSIRADLPAGAYGNYNGQLSVGSPIGT